MNPMVKAETWASDGPEAVRQTPWNIDRAGPGTFRYEGRRWRFDDVIVTDARQTPCSVLPRVPASDEDLHYTTVFFIAEGLFSLNDSATPQLFTMGGAGWVPGWSRVACETLTPTRFIAVALHDRVLHRHGTTLPTRTGRLSARDPLLAPTLAFLHAFTIDPVSATLPAGHPTGTLIADLVIALLPRTTPDQAQPSLSGLYETALTVIRVRHTDPAFTPQALAEGLHVSLRQLQRSFAEHDQTIGAAITHERLTSAITALHSATPPASLSLLAEHAGMSLKELRHAAKTTYGLTPRQLRAATPQDL